MKNSLLVIRVVAESTVGPLSIYAIPLDAKIHFILLIRDGPGNKLFLLGQAA